MPFWRFVQRIAIVLRHASKSRYLEAGHLRSYVWRIEPHDGRQAPGQPLAVLSKKAQNRD